jgi:tight adherence protein B
MIRCFALAGSVAACLLVCAAAGAAQPGDVSFTPVARLSFPERGFLVSLPTTKQLTAADVTVRENGEPVADPSFVPAETSREQLGTVVVLDASDSMRGQPLSEALSAAKQFAEQFGGREERVGLIAFSNSWRIVQRPSSSSDLVASLSGVTQTHAGTHIYDALAGALNVIHTAKLASASIVLLSDGADTGSKTTATQLLTRAQRSRVRIFTVGLRSPQFDAAPLRLLARGTGADFVEATTSSSLAPIFAALGRRLASEYLLRYRSLASPGSPVVVTVRVHGVGLSTFEYTPPKIAPVSPFHRSLFERFWSSAASLVLISFLAAIFVGASIALLVRRPRSTVRKRIAEFATLVSTKPDDTAAKTPFSTRLLAGTEQSLARTRWWTRFREELEIAEVKLTAEQLLATAILGTLLLGLVLYQFVPIFSIFGLAAPGVVYGYCRRQLRRVQLAFESQLPDNLQVLASALRAGHSFTGALSVVANDAAEPSKREFSRIVADEQLGVPLEDSLREVARRMANTDLDQVALVAELQRRSGGNMAEVLDRVVETVRNRFDLRRMVRTLTAQGRMARWILSMLPVFLGLIIALLNPGYLAPLFTTGGGQIIVTFAATMVIIGSLVIKRIVNIRV